MKKLIFILAFCLITTLAYSATYKYVLQTVEQSGTDIALTFVYYRDTEVIGEKRIHIREDLSLNELKALAEAEGEEFKTIGGYYERLKTYEGTEVTY